jgi:hypothetical protein
MGAHHRRKYTILRHWLFDRSKAGFVRLGIAEERSTLDSGSPNLVIFRGEDQIAAYSHNQYGGEYLYPERDLPVTAT